MRTEALRQWLLGRVADRTGMTPESIDPHQPLNALGLDSESIVALTGELSEAVGHAIDPVLFYSYPTIAAVTDFLAEDASRGQAPYLSKSDPAAPGEPIAIVGLACRFPGAPDKDGFWSLLQSRGSAISKDGRARWDLTTEEAELGPIEWGGFLQDIDRFAGAFFGIGREEARRMDPQQRLLLETSWEAFQDAGLSTDSLRGRLCDVFVGISTNEYAKRQTSDISTVGAYTGTGAALSIAANRLSYVFDLRGESMAVDTACSSSMVALHLAVKNLRGGASEMALVGGVNLLLDPELSAGMAKAGMLASDGRCKTFDAGADGYVRGEGCGAVVLKTLRDAMRDRDRIYAVIRGVSVNQDGRSNGLTAPNGLAQQALIRSALRDAAVDAADIVYVEAHGTGTPLGDPVEANSLAAVLGDGQGGSVGIGSVKTNIGHLEAGAGVASVIKIALSIQNGAVPPTLHFQTLNPRIAAGRLSVAADGWPLPQPPEQRLCGISAFGFGGANAHVVMAGPPSLPVTRTPPPRGALLIPISAPDAPALADFAGRLAKAPGWSDEDLVGVGHTLAIRRDHLATRAACVAGDAEGFRTGLTRLARAPAPKPARRNPRVAMIFAGQGSQAHAMSRALASSEPLFASTLRRCDEVTRAEAGWSLLDVLAGDVQALDSTRLAQPCIVAFGIALFELYWSYGLLPAVVAGHSVGEIPAAYAAGALSLDDAMRLACRRGAAMAEAHGRGSMLAARIDAAAGLAHAQPGRIDVAAVNSASEVVFSGDRGALEDLRGKLLGEGRFAAWINDEYAFHSYQMQDAAIALEAGLADLHPNAISTDFVSTVTAERMRQGSLDGAYWRRNLAEPVRFADAIGGISGEVDLCIEIGGRPVLQKALGELLGESVVVASSAPGSDERRAWLESLAKAYEVGCDLDFHGLYRDHSPLIDLPTPHLPRERYWLNRTQSMAESGRGLLGKRHPLAAIAGVEVWDSILDTQRFPFLADHMVGGAVVLPAAAQIAMMAEAARQCGLGPIVDLESMAFRIPILLGEKPVRLQTLARRTDHGLKLDIAAARPDGGYATCSVAEARTGRSEALTDRPASALRGVIGSPSDLYAQLKESGLFYGAAFRPLVNVSADEHRAWGDLEVDPSVRARADASLTVLLDGGFHLLQALRRQDGHQGILVPASIETVRVHALPRGGDQIRGEAEAAGPVGAARIKADIVVRGAEGPIVQCRGLVLAPAGHSANRRPPEGLNIYESVWRHAEMTSPAIKGDLVLVASASPLADAVAEAVLKRSARVHRVLVEPGASIPSIDPTSSDAWRTGLRDAARQLPSATAILVLLDPSVSSQAKLAADAEQAALAALGAIGGLSYAGFPAPMRLFFVHHRNASEIAAAPFSDPGLASVAGICRTAHFETPNLTCTCIDLGSTESLAAEADRLLDEVGSGPPDTEITLIGAKRLVRRIRRLTMQGAPLVATPSISAEAAYLVTGGAGGLGTSVVRWLCEQGAGLVGVISRSESDSAWWLGLGEHAAKVRHFRADISDATEMARIIGALSADWPIAGVVHAAGVLDDGPLLAMGHDAFERVFTPKARGLDALWSACAAVAPDWIALYSSAASALGSPGQANYVAANAYMDAFAVRAQDAGIRVFCLNWGPWDQVGMAAEAGSDTAALAGISLIPPDQGLRAFEWALGSDVRRPIILPFELENLVQYYPEGPGFALFEDLLAGAEINLRNAGDRSALAMRPELETPFVAPETPLETLIAGMWSRALGLEKVGLNDNFFALGGDSVLANQIFVEISATLGVGISPEEAFENLTVADLAKLADQRAMEIISQMAESTLHDLMAG